MTDQRPFAALPPPEKDEAGEEEPRIRRSFLPDGAIGIFFLLILAAVSGGLIAAYWPWAQGNEASPERIANLESRVNQIAAGRAPNVAEAAYGEEQKSLAALKMRLDADEARLTAMENAGSGGAGDAGAVKSDLDRIGQRLAKLEQMRAPVDAAAKLSQRVAQLEKSAPPPDLTSRLDGFALKSGEEALGARVARLETQNASDVMKRAASLLALADLVRASAAGDGFATELNTLHALQPAAPELADLSRYAQGAPTRPALKASLSAQAGDVLAAERNAKVKSWSQRLWANLVGLVSIRRTGDVPGDGTEARLARAEAALGKDDLARATGEMAGLKGAAREAAAPWIAQAQARLAIDRDTRLLMSRTIASLSSASLPGQP
jgi:hypothetical protein